MAAAFTPHAAGRDRIDPLVAAIATVTPEEARVVLEALEVWANGSDYPTRMASIPTGLVDRGLGLTLYKRLSEAYRPIREALDPEAREDAARQPHGEGFYK